MLIEIWTIGRDPEPYIATGIKSYIEKVRPYAQVSMVVIPSPKKLAGAAPEVVKKAEGEIVVNRLTAQHHLIALDERGKSLSSTDWAAYFGQCMNTSVRTLVLLIGGSYGLSAEVRQAARGVWSLSPLVLPHNLVRLIVSEQIYRAYAILNRLPYHHV